MSVSRPNNLVITPDDFQRMFPGEPLPDISNNSLRLLVPIAQKFAEPPISNFKVGVAILGESGNMYLGGNIEFTGNQFSQTVHGEQCAVGTAARHGERKMIQLAVNATPCGHCRQFLNEQVNSSDTLQIHCGSAEGIWSVYKLSELLPNSFGPADLGINEPLNMFRGSDVKEVDLDKKVAEGSLSPHVSKWFGKDSEENESKDWKALVEEVKDQAFRAALKSYVPYSKCPAGIACALQSGKIIQGSYFENAAFNPTLAPFQHLAIGIMDAMPEGSTIVEELAKAQYMCLVEGNEKDSSIVYHQNTIESLVGEMPVESMLFEVLRLPKSKSKKRRE